MGECWKNKYNSLINLLMEEFDSSVIFDVISKLEDEKGLKEWLEERIHETQVEIAMRSGFFTETFECKLRTYHELLEYVEKNTHEETEPLKSTVFCNKNRCVNNIDGKRCRKFNVVMFNGICRDERDRILNWIKKEIEACESALKHSVNPDPWQARKRAFEEVKTRLL